MMMMMRLMTRRTMMMMTRRTMMTRTTMSTDLPDGSSPRRSGGGEVGGKPGNLDQLKT